MAVIYLHKYLMKIYKGNCQPAINCDQLILDIVKYHVEPFHGFLSLTDDHPNYNDINDQKVKLEKAGYDASTVEYTHYKSGIHFDKTVETTFGQLVGATPLLCWISEILPGKCSPWHWDVNPWEDEHKKLGTLVRYFCFLSKPAGGHVFVVEDESYYYEEQGSIYQYPDIRAYHAGANIGLTTKYLLTFTGYQ
jgi:hypothetical protein